MAACNRVDYIHIWCILCKYFRTVLNNLTITCLIYSLNMLSYSES